jgi:hypothetical protein
MALIAIGVVAVISYYSYTQQQVSVASREHSIATNLKLIQLSNNKVLLQGSITNVGIGINEIKVEIRGNENNIRSNSVSITESEEFINDVLNCKSTRFNEYPIIISINDTYYTTVRVSVES